MKRKDINDYISYNLYGYGQGYRFDCFINDDFVGNSSEMRKLAQEHDEIKVEIYSGMKSYWGANHVKTLYFTIENDPNVLKNYHKIKITKPHDSQRQKVYNAETRMLAFFDTPEKLSPENCQNLANEVWQDYGFNSNPPTVIVSSAKKRTSTSYSWNRTIKLAQGWGQSKKVVLHEIAHQIVDNGYRYNDPGHGKHFTAILLELYEMYLGWNREQMLNCFASYNCKIADIN